MSAYTPYWQTSPYPSSGWGYYGYPQPTQRQGDPSPNANHTAQAQKSKVEQPEAIQKLIQNLISSPEPSKPEPRDAHPHKHKPSSQSPSERLIKHLTGAGLALVFGLLLNNPILARKVPAKFSGIISSDWTDWAKIIAGMVTANHITKAFDWQLPPWGSAILAVATINPITLGFNKKALLQTLVMAPLVALVVQGSSSLHKRVKDPLKDNLGIPHWATQLGLSAGLIGVSLMVYPRILLEAGKRGLLGAEEQIRAAKVLEAKNAGSRNMLGTEGAVCSNGCCASSICMREIGEMIGASANWFKSHLGLKPTQHKDD